MSAPRPVTDGVYRLGTSWVNWYLLVAPDGITVVDCGLAGYHDQLVEALAAIDRPPADVEAVVLTHYHSDHVGSAERIRNECGARVLAPAGDAEGVRTGDVPVPGGALANAWRPRMVRYLAHAMRNGGAKVTPVGEVEAYGEGETLSVPGALRAVHTAGHTAGHCSLLAAGHDTLFAGDALATMSLAGGPAGPQLVAANEDRDEARRSLSRLRKLPASIVCPGHGDPFEGSPADAVKAALAA